MALDPRNLPRAQYLRTQFRDGRPLGGDQPDTREIYFDGRRWEESRKQVHKDVVEKIEAGFSDIPCGRQAVFLGGVPGSGKGFFRENAQGLTDGYAVVDPDQVRDVLIETLRERGQFPDVDSPVAPGLTDRELSGYFQRETTDIANLLYSRSVDAGRNLVVDTSMGDQQRTMSYLDQLKSGPEDQRYKATQILVQCDADVAEERRIGRYRDGLETDELGGRLPPDNLNSDVEANAPQTFQAGREREFGFDESLIVDTTTEPRVVSAWIGNEPVSKLPHVGQLDFSRGGTPLQYLNTLSPDEYQTSYDAAQTSFEHRQTMFQQELAETAISKTVVDGQEFPVFSGVAGIGGNKVPVENPMVDPAPTQTEPSPNKQDLTGPVEIPDVLSPEQLIEIPLDKNAQWDLPADARPLDVKISELGGGFERVAEEPLAIDPKGVDAQLVDQRSDTLTENISPPIEPTPNPRIEDYLSSPKETIATEISPQVGLGDLSLTTDSSDIDMAPQSTPEIDSIQPFTVPNPRPEDYMPKINAPVPSSPTTEVQLPVEQTPNPDPADYMQIEQPADPGIEQAPEPVVENDSGFNLFGGGEDTNTSTEIEADFTADDSTIEPAINDNVDAGFENSDMGVDSFDSSSQIDAGVADASMGGEAQSQPAISSPSI